jgi:primosomal replication protein N
METENQVILFGQISKIYPDKITPSGTKISSFVLNHESEQKENNSLRKVKLRMFCVLVNQNNILVSDFLNAKVKVSGFLSQNLKEQIILNVNNLVLNNL